MSGAGRALALPLARYRFTAQLEADLPLPVFAGPLLRSVFGAALHHVACTTGQPRCSACPLWRSCPYPAVFETPPRPTQFEQQFSQVPNPYVIEPPLAGEGDGMLCAGEPLVWHMVLAGEPTLTRLDLIVHAWRRALRQGLGERRVPGRLLSVERLDPDGGAPLPVLAGDGSRVTAHESRLWLPLPAVDADESATPTLEATLHLTTPLRLQHQGQALGPEQLDARTLLSQMLRRTNLMLDLHLGVRPAPFDAPALLAAVLPVLSERRALRWQDAPRYSARQRREMNLRGVVGRWTINAPAHVLAPLLPWLHLGQWLHLGKNATMGLGAYRLETSTTNALLSKTV